MKKLFLLIYFLSLPALAQPKLPVSELHVHAEAGVLTPELIDTLAKKHHLSVSSKDFYKNGMIDIPGNNFMSFLKVYDKASALMKDPDDITLVLYDYLKRCHEDGAIYIEFTTSPNHFKHLRYKQVVDAAAKAIDKAKHDFGIESRMLIVLLRHEGLPLAKELLNKILVYRHPYVVGISLAGDDVHYPAKAYLPLYQKAQKAGLKLTAHMGEHTGPDDIKLAVKMKLNRIGHGLSVMQDPKLIELVSRKRIGLEICPSSNLNGGLYKSLAEHPVGKMIAKGMYVSINTDDPAFDATSIGKEYENVRKAYHLTDKQMIQLCRNAVNMSFAEPALKKKLLAKIDVYERQVIKH